MPWGVAAAVIGGAASIYSGRQQSKAAGKAIKGEREAAAAALDIQQGYYEEGKAALQPYAAQEQAASTQMMAQMGLAPPAGAGARGGDVWGFGAPAAGQAPEEQAASRLMEDLITQQMVINHRTIDLDARNIAESSRQARERIREMKASGQLPQDFPELSQAEWSDLGYQQRQAHGGMKSMRRSPQMLKLGDDPDVQGLAQTYFPGGQAVGGDFQTQQMGAGQMLDPRTGQPGQRVGMQQRLTAGPQMGEPIEGEFLPAGTGPAPQTAQDIMRRAGIEGMPIEIQQQYLRELAEDPRADPELATYLGLTPESLQVGSAYQETPAYAAAREAGIEVVNQGAAGAGTLYSGSRGEALRDVGQGVEQAYYMDAMNRRELMMGARRQERTGAISRRGSEYGAERSREQSYYNNYMNLLNQMSAPTTTTNIAAMGTNIGTATSANLLGTARNVGELQMGQAAIWGGVAGDIASGAGRAAEMYINRPRETDPVTGAYI